MHAQGEMNLSVMSFPGEYTQLYHYIKKLMGQSKAAGEGKHGSIWGRGGEPEQRTARAEPKTSCGPTLWVLP